MTIMVTGTGGMAGYNSVRSLNIVGKEKILSVDMNSHVAGKYISDYFSTVSAINNEDYISEMNKLINRYDVNILLPTINEEIPILSRYKDNIDTKMLIPSEKCATICNDKYLMNEIFIRYDIPTPMTFLATEYQPDGNITIVKPRIGRGGKGVKIIDNPKDFNFHDLTDNYIAQSYINGIIFGMIVLYSNDFEIVNYVSWEKHVIDEFGTAIKAVTVKRDEIYDLVKKIGKKFNLVGLIDIEMIYSKEDGFKVFDINPRIGGNVYLATMSGINLPQQYCEICLGEKIKRQEFQEGVVLSRSKYWDFIQ